MTQPEAFGRFAKIAAEFEAATFAITYVFGRWNVDPAIAVRARRVEVTATELSRSADTLEVTFALRLSAAFEAVLRKYWASGLGRPTRPDMMPLMDGIARRRRMGATDLQLAHDVRSFRNDAVHAGGSPVRIPLADCQRNLGRHLRWLPQQW